jgi:colicin import membrane protein
MHAVADRLEFSPPSPPGLLRAFGLALLAHGLLVAALTWGVQWKHNAPVVSAEAELWSAVPEEAAPKLQEPPPEPVVEPEPSPKPAPEPEPVVETPKVDIALEQEKLRLKKQKQAELEKQQAKLKAEKLKAEQLKIDQLKADKLKQEALTKKIAEQEAQKLETQRQSNLNRMAGLAGGSGPSTSTGTALKSSGPSANYAGRIRARIKPNIVFTETINGNPTAEVEVRTSPDGTIISRKLTQSSGNKSWDDAVLKAIDKTEVLPRDTDGRVPSAMTITFRPKD